MLADCLKRLGLSTMICGLALSAEAVGSLPTLSGYVYLDKNNSGVFDSGDVGIGGVLVTLTGTDFFDNVVTLTTNTQPDGSYLFEDLAPSDNTGYTVTEGATPAYLENTNNVGSERGTWTPGTDFISNIVIPFVIDLVASNYN